MQVESLGTIPAPFPHYNVDFSLSRDGSNESTLTGEGGWEEGLENKAVKGEVCVVNFKF